MHTLRETESGNGVPCQIARMTFIEIAAAQFSWGREFQRRHAKRVHDDDSLIWTRGFLANTPSTGDRGLTGYVIAAAGDVQGMIVIDEDLRSSKIQPPMALAYVRYLATAPWNRRCDEYLGRYCGVGRLLVVQAIVESITLGTFGRVGLHSFVGASTFYERLGFANLGVDPVERGMLYFELLPNAAHSLLNGNR